MHVLFIVPYVPNLIRIRPYSLIRNLAANGHQVTVMTLWENENELEDLQILKSQCSEVHSFHLSKWRSLWNCVVAVPSENPLQSVYCWQPKLDRLIKDSVTEASKSSPYDIVHVEHLRGAQYALSLKSALGKRNFHLPIVWDSVDCISLLFRLAASRSSNLFRRLITRLDLRRTEKYEGWLIDQFDHVLVTSSADRQALISLSNSDKAPLNITILPNGVDLNYFQPNPSALREPNTLVVSGKMSYHANIAMVRFLVREIMPLVWSRHPDVKLNIIGKDPPGEILAMGDDSRVMISGTVPDLRIYLQTASIAVAPIIYGVGIQNKVLEAMACQTPVVASPQAVSALNILPGQDAFVADGADAFANAIITLIEQPDLRRQVSINGYQYVREKHNWTDITLQLEDIYRKSNKRTIH